MFIRSYGYQREYLVTGDSDADKIRYFYYRFVILPLPEALTTTTDLKLYMFTVFVRAFVIYMKQRIYSNLSYAYYRYLSSEIKYVHYVRSNCAV